MRFSLYKKHIFVKLRLKQHACSVDPLGVSYDFLHTRILMFLDLQKGRTQTKKRAPFRPKRGPKGVPFRVLRNERGPWLAGNPVC